MNTRTFFTRSTLIVFLAAGSMATAGIAIAKETTGIQTKPTKTVKPSFDLLQTSITTDGNLAVFSMQVSGKAGASKPTKNGKLAGSRVYSYVWPTSLDPATVGFNAKSGILAFAATSHRDFDDTPLYDENGDGNLANDGNLWHSHWVVLTKDDACGKGSLKVVDIAEGTKPALPTTWPGLPILIDSPGWTPIIRGQIIEVRVPFDNITAVNNATFDGVAAGLRVNESVHNPLLCVEKIFKVASGDLSLPGKVNK